MRALSKQLTKLWADIDRFTSTGAPAHASALHVSDTTSGLGDKMTDTGPTPGRSRMEQYWGELKPKTGPILGRLAERDPERWLWDTQAGIERFRLRSIEFGNWETQQQRLNVFYASMASFDDLARVLKISREKIGFDRSLSLALGARGNGNRGWHTAAAHFEQLPYAIINLTKPHGKGALSHEFAHAWDNLVARALGHRADTYLSGGRQVWNGPDRDRLADPGIVGAIEHCFVEILGDPTKGGTAFWKRIAKQDTYTRRRLEIWARCFEVYIAHQLKAQGIINYFLAHPLGMYGGIWPTGSEIRPLATVIEQIVRMGFEDVREGVFSHAAHRSTIMNGFLQGAATRVAMAARTIDATYALVELSDLVISHDPKTFKANPAYPTGCQQRDYGFDKAEQAAVHQYARHFDPSFLITDTPSAVDGPPIVNKNHVVLGGNKRVMVLANLDDYQTYVSELKRRLSPFYGIDADQVGRFRRPVLVRMIDISMTDCAMYSNMLNRGLTQGMSLTTSTVSYARQLSTSELETIGKIFEAAGANTPAEALARPKVVRELVDIFRRSEIITDRNRSEWIDAGGGLTEQGRLMLERTVLGALLPDRALIETARAYTVQLLKVLPLLVRGRGLPAEWEPMQWITAAIRLESRRHASGIDKVAFSRQTAFDQAETTPEVGIMWDALDAGPRRFRTFIEGYVQQAENESKLDAGAGFAFTTVMTPRQVLEGMAKKIGLECQSCGGRAESATLTDRVTERKAPILRLPARLKKFLGNLPQGFLMLIWGPAGGGKSTLAVYLASQLGLLGAVLWVLGEDKMKYGRMADRARRMAVRLSNVQVLEPATRGFVLFSDIEHQVAAGKIKFLVVDSKDTVYTKPWTDLATIHDWNGLLDRYPELSIILISHADTAGRIPLGGSNWRYLCSVEVYVDRDRMAKVIKNWDGPRGTMKVF